MNQTKFPWPLLLIVVAAAVFFFSRQPGSPLPQPSPAPAVGPNMVRAFSTNDNRAEAKAHMHAFATMQDALADLLEYDGKLDKPRLTTGVQVDDFQRAVREYRMKGWSFGYRYPDLRTELQTWFDGQVGDSGGSIDVDDAGHPNGRRQKWIQALRTCAASCRYAQQLE